MSAEVRPRSTVRRAVWLGGLLVVLGGLFGMHGLDSHGSAGLDTIAHAAGNSAMTAHHEAVSVLPVALSGADGHTGIDMGAAGVCMAVLVLTLVALILRMYGSRARPLLWLAARPTRAPEGRGRDPDSPSLTHLSIQRC